MNRYQLLEQISQNNITTGWKARDLSTDRSCFVKSLRTDVDEGLRNEAVRRLTASHGLQRRIRTTRLVTSRESVSNQHALLLVYPWIDTENSGEGKKILTDNPRLVEACVLVDFLHLLGLVHSDLKLDSFLIESNRSGERLHLGDLEFLQEERSLQSGILSGTPGHIAPEVERNQPALVQSDLYSLGRSVAMALEAITDTNEPAPERRACLVRFAALLTRPQPYQRPGSLLQALAEAGLIGKKELASAEKRVFAMLWLNQIRRHGHSGLSRKEAVRRYCERTGVLGFDDGTVEAFSRGYEVRPLMTWRLVAGLVDRSTLVRRGHFWHIQPDPESLFQFFGAVLEFLDDGLSREAVLELKEFHLARLERRLREDSSLTPEEFAVRVWEAVDLALALNRQRTAYDLMLEWKERQSDPPGADEARRIVSQAIKIGDVDYADALAAETLERCDNESELGLLLRRLSAWISGLRGEFALSDTLLGDIEVTARQKGYSDVEFLAMYTRGVNMWRAKNAVQSSELLQAALTLARKHRLAPRLSQASAALALVCVELGDYRRTIRHARATVRFAKVASSSAHLSSALEALIASYVRLCDFDKAVYWLEKYRQTTLVDNVDHHLGTYYQLLGFIHANIGDPDTAVAALQQSTTLGDKTSHARTRMKAHQVMAEVALYRGDESEFARQFALALALSEQTNDERTKAILAMIEAARLSVSAPADPSRSSAELTRTSSALAALGERFYAMIGLFIQLWSSGGRIDMETTAIAETLGIRTGDKAVPMIEALAGMLESTRDGAGEVSARGWRSAYRVLRNSRMMFMALLAAERAADVYVAENRRRHAQKYYREAIALASLLGNEPISGRLAAKSGEVSSISEDYSRLVLSLQQVSVLIGGLGRQESNLSALLEFAVDQTGAERGVLFLKSSETESLRAVAVEACDGQSLSDVASISQNLLRDAIDGVKPVVVHNALTDKRTREFRSILLHNVLSVLAVPLIHDDRPIGVLYLDHSNIPHVFEADDLHLVHAIGNFLSASIWANIQSRTWQSIAMHNEPRGRRADTGTPFITQDPILRALLEKLPRIAVSSSPVLITGESGTGKEVLCDLIQRQSQRADRPYVKVNCAAIPESLIESELFGVGKRVATGVDPRVGKFSLADGGTMFLDEIADMALHVQAKVLRAVEYQQFEKVGSNKTQFTDIRFIYATNKDLRRLVDQNHFRGDLYHRISVITIEIPPLRNRTADIPLLIEHFLADYPTASRSRFTARTIDRLMAYHWPGNVRELSNIVERMRILHGACEITPELLPADILYSANGPGNVPAEDGRAKAAMILAALNKTEWNQSRAAQLLGMPLTTLRRNLKKYGIHR